MGGPACKRMSNTSKRWRSGSAGLHCIAAFTHLETKSAPVHRGWGRVKDGNAQEPRYGAGVGYQSHKTSLQRVATMLQFTSWNLSWLQHSLLSP